MLKIFSIFFLTSLLTKKLDGQATGSSNAPMPIGGVTPPMPMINATSKVPLVDRKNFTTSPLVPMPRDENDEDDDSDGGSFRSCRQDNEFFDRCGGCESTCTNPNPSCTSRCNFNNAGCRCRDGFVRDRNGRCISPRNCPNNNPSCGRNEIFNECGGCEATCNNPNPSCPFFNCGRGACRCRDGMVRHPNGNCVDPQQCFSNQCRPNEVFNRCSSGCEGTCSNTRPFCMFDSQFCRFPKCECPVSNGFVRDDFGHCIPSSQCSDQDFPSCRSTLCPRRNVCVMRKPSNCRFCREQPTCIRMPSCHDIRCSRGFRCTIPSCQRFPCDPICVPFD